ncbi:MAG: hypothetical protein PHS44_03825 [Candidatus Dojkabacteria bacterium]|nr:hypothetical protein [Candidatus Dojkabacteria bacterium]
MENEYTRISKFLKNILSFVIVTVIGLLISTAYYNFVELREVSGYIKIGKTVRGKEDYTLVCEIENNSKKVIDGLLMVAPTDLVINDFETSSPMQFDVQKENKTAKEQILEISKIPPDTRSSIIIHSSNIDFLEYIYFLNNEEKQLVLQDEDELPNLTPVVFRSAVMTALIYGILFVLLIIREEASKYKIYGEINATRRQLKINQRSQKMIEQREEILGKDIKDLEFRNKELVKEVDYWKYLYKKIIDQVELKKGSKKKILDLTNNPPYLKSKKLKK